MLSNIATIIPVVMVVTEFAKKRLNLDGWAVIGISLIISAGGAVYIGLTGELSTIQIVLTAIATSVSANGGYDLIKEIAKYVGDNE